jgi:alpha-tubulin suppressor-like RCC1 family protein
MLYFSIYGKSNIVEPIVEIKISPDNITTTSHIKYNYREVSKSDHNIVEEVWEGNRDCFPSAGEYEVALKVRNSQNVWSEKAKKIINVTEEPGIKSITSSQKVLFIIYNNGQVKYQAFSTNKLNLPTTDAFTVYDTLEGVLDISMNYDHALVQINDRTVKAAGSNGYGQLALNTKIDKPSFSKIWGLENVKSIQTGDKISAAMTKSGLYLWGKNDVKQIAFTTQVYYDMPQKFNLLRDLEDYSVGKDHVLFKTKSGKVYGQGCNDS